MSPHTKRLVIAVVLLFGRPFVLAAEETGNALFEQLRSEGVPVAAETKAPLPGPLMADGLDAAGQRAVLEKVVGKRFTVRDFTAKLGTAPHVYKIRKIANSSDDAPRMLGIDVSFVAYGSLDTVAKRDFLEKLQSMILSAAILPPAATPEQQAPQAWAAPAA